MTTLVHDARVCMVRGVDPFDEPIASVLIKRTYRFVPGRGLEVVEPSAWVDEPVSQRCGDRWGRWLRNDCELFPYKCLTDVIVQGHVVAPGERPTRSLWASVQIGRQRKDVLVLGDRFVESGRISEPAPFVRLPLCWTRAFGGVDVDPTAAISVGEIMRCLHPEQHPHAYSRNPVGTGWSTASHPRALEGLMLPNYEDPRRPLTLEQLAAFDRRLWSLAPEPQGFGWVSPSWYPRSAFAGVLPTEPALDDEFGMSEVEAGWIPRGFSHAFDCWGARSGADLRVCNGAPAGLRMRVRGGELLGFVGFAREGEVVLRLPEAPRRVQMFARGRTLEVEVALHTLRIEPDDRRLTLIWAARARVDQAVDVTAIVDGQILGDALEAAS